MMAWTHSWLGSKTHGFQSRLCWQLSPHVQLLRGRRENGALLRYLSGTTQTSFLFFAFHPTALCLPGGLRRMQPGAQSIGKRKENALLWKGCKFEETKYQAQMMVTHLSRKRGQGSWERVLHSPILSPVLPAMVSLELKSQAQSSQYVHTPSLGGWRPRSLKLGILRVHLMGVEERLWVELRMLPP